MGACARVESFPTVKKRTHLSQFRSIKSGRDGWVGVVEGPATLGGGVVALVLGCGSSGVPFCGGAAADGLFFLALGWDLLFFDFLFLEFSGAGCEPTPPSLPLPPPKQ